MYKVYINGLLNVLSNHCYAIFINGLSLSFPSFADDISLISAFMVSATILNQGTTNPDGRMEYMANTDDELSAVSDVSIHL